MKHLLARLLSCLRHSTKHTTLSAQEAGSISHAQHAETQQTYFFDAVPADVLFVVVKHLSEQPYGKDWLHSVNSNDAQTVLRIGGALSVASREMFKSLDFQGIHLKSSNDIEMLTNLMAPHLEQIYIYRPELRLLNCERFSSLRSLKFKEDVGWHALERILSVCGDILEELEIESWWLERRVVQAIACHCKSLKVFKPYYIQYRASLKRIWNAVGSTLIEFRGRVPNMELSHIAAHCTRLEKLNLRNIQQLMRGGGNEVVDLLAKLKSLRILVLYVSNEEQLTCFSVNNLERLLDACSPNVRIDCDTKLDNDVGLAEYIDSIGARLRALRLTCNFRTTSTDALHVHTNIEELSLTTLNAFADGILELIFAAPLPNLRKLYVSDVNNSKILRHVARSVSNLREFECYFGWKRRVPLNRSDFFDLFGANKHLHYITLYYWIIDDRETNLVTELIPCLKVCRQLKNVAFTYKKEAADARLCTTDKSEELSNVCVSLRNKALCLSVNNVCYLPV